MENVKIFADSADVLMKTVFIVSKNIDAEKIFKSVQIAPVTLKNIDNADTVIAVAKSDEVEEISNLIPNSNYLKILITDKKVDACANFDTFFLNLNDAEKIIPNLIVALMPVKMLDFADIVYVLQNAGEAVILSGEGVTGTDALKNAMATETNKNLYSAKGIILRPYGNLNLLECTEITAEIEKNFPDDAVIMWDVDFHDKTPYDKVTVILILTQFNRNKNFLFVAAKSSEVAAISSAIKNSPAALKILITDKKIDACEDFDAFILDFDNAGKIIDRINKLTAPSAMFPIVGKENTFKLEFSVDYFDIERTFKNSGEVIILSGKGSNVIEATQNALNTDKNLNSIKAIIVSIIYPLNLDAGLNELYEVEKLIQKNINFDEKIFSELRYDENICDIVNVYLMITKF